MKLRSIPAADFDLEKTLGSGQVFQWGKCGPGFVGAIGEIALYLEQRGEILKVRFDETPKPARETRALPGIVARYFAFDHPLGEICATFPRDETMKGATNFCCGLRIIRQPKWECLAMFICSSMKQVAHIRQMSRAMRERFGKRMKVAGSDVFTFPKPATVAQLSEADLRGCGLGYRAKNLLATAKRVASGEADLEQWSKLADGELQDALCGLPGVGAKVANCVMLFAYERTRAFPIDVWIARVLRAQYFAGKRKPTDRRLRDFAAEYFGEHGGYAQQYLFHHARMTQPRGRSAPRRGPSTALRSARDDEPKRRRPETKR